MGRVPCGRYSAFRTILLAYLFAEILPLRRRQKRRTLHTDSPDRLEFPFADFQILHPRILE